MGSKPLSERQTTYLNRKFPNEFPFNFPTREKNPQSNMLGKAMYVITDQKKPQISIKNWGKDAKEPKETGTLRSRNP